MTWSYFPGVPRLWLSPNLHLMAMSICFISFEGLRFYVMASSDSYKKDLAIRRKKRLSFLKVMSIHFGGLSLLFLIMLYDKEGIRYFEDIAFLYYLIVVKAIFRVSRACFGSKYGYERNEPEL